MIGPVREGVTAVLARPVKSVLTALGVVVGATALVIMLGLAGMNDAILQSQVSAASANQVEGDLGAEVFLGREDQVAAHLDGLGMTQVVFFATTADARVILRTISGGSKDVSGNVVALAPGVQSRSDITLANGSWSLVCDVDGAAIGATLAREAGVRVGHVLVINGRAHPVVAVVEDSDSMPTLMLSVATCLSPDVSPTTDVTSIHFSGYTQPGAAGETAAVLPGVIGRPHKSDVSARAVPDASALARAVASSVVDGARYVSLTAIVLGLLMVAVVMNTMVVERLSSYSLKKSLGASGRQIITEVIVHGALLGLVGGVVGLAVGILALAVVAHLREATAYLPWAILALPLGACLAGGVVGLWPAAKAARADPINFLRD